MIAKIARRVHDLGGRALLVGGCVRDELLGIPCYDIDCEIHGIEPETLKELLMQIGGIDESGTRYGIYTIRDTGLDIALPRREICTGPSHKDFEVHVDPFLSPEAAAARRDFTVNAIMRDALTGKYVDPYGGMEDVKNGVLRAVPGGQFEEDSLRVLRGAQFAARFHLTPDEKTIESMRRMDICSLSAARVFVEMKKALLMADEPDVFFRVLEKADALKYWFPELEALRKTPQNPQYHPEGDAFEHTMMVLRAAAQVKQQAKDQLAFMLAALCHDLGKAVSTKKNDKGAWASIGHENTGAPLCERMLSRLGVSKSVIGYVQNMCALHMRVHTCYYGKARVSRTNVLFDESTAADELAWLVVCDTRGTGKPRKYADEEQAFIFKRLEEYEQIIASGMPDAKMLMARGVAPGPQLKKALAYARKQVLCGKAVERACEQAVKAFATE
ncbi:MAG: HDIG domain-containing protein [Clostridia bacterium]|nr:HDIG domain-containing protein [Clostridia bacterium]